MKMDGFTVSLSIQVLLELHKDLADVIRGAEFGHCIADAVVFELN
ncbi:hypothetical protein HNR65_003546 [Desulfosalsimonas propionicica]|uniref:Uncharacterized protein n=1 Tax=Desulfosalsimonas propionicica TaxID=332175 RepID=A0A7W0CCE4_9BACT|nr:hypothetical protein [Desulfosalsimonas propionicica]